MQKQSVLAILISALLAFGAGCNTKSTSGEDSKDLVSSINTDSSISTVLSSEVAAISSLNNTISSSTVTKSSSVLSKTSILSSVFVAPAGTEWFKNIKTADLNVVQINPPKAADSVQYDSVIYSCPERELVSNAALIAQGTVIGQPVKYKMQYKDTKTNNGGSGYGTIFQFKLKSVYYSKDGLKQGDTVRITYADYNLINDSYVKEEDFITIENQKDYILFAHDDDIEIFRNKDTGIHNKYAKNMCDYWLYDGYNPIIVVGENNTYGFSNINVYMQSIRIDTQTVLRETMPPVTFYQINDFNERMVTYINSFKNVP